ncbi:hypothetical protein CVT26_004353 [Gymnopilus dilepis]|uniref:C2H2-type domain-containing protein n=1 Tax=Gymnopilus dilepis TaxID=231916 RepID=A0A409WU76_9AGAR|nr:hypothetical protein CVT26_004353 [Gymnopilus dilepis]
MKQRYDPVREAAAIYTPPKSTAQEPTSDIIDISLFKRLNDLIHIPCIARNCGTIINTDDPNALIKHMELDHFECAHNRHPRVMVAYCLDFACPFQCRQGYAAFGELDEHIRSKHWQLDVLVCSICSMNITNGEEGAKEHVLKEHPGKKIK